MLNLSASLSLWSGRAAEARALTVEAGAAAVKAEDHGALVQALALQGRALVSLGRIAEGTDLLEEAFVTADRLGDRDSRRIAIIANCASAARIGEPERAIRWAARYEGVHDNPTNVGEADLMVSMALALVQRGAVGEAATQLSWAGEGAHSERSGHFEEAVAALIAAIQGRYEEVTRSVQSVIADHSTYLDRVLALSSRAAAKQAAGDTEGRDAALAAAWEELEGTDDQTSRLILNLLEAMCGLSDLATAQQVMQLHGLDPTGWRATWSAAIGSTAAAQG